MRSTHSRRPSPRNTEHGLFLSLRLTRHLLSRLDLDRHHHAHSSQERGKQRRLHFSHDLSRRSAGTASCRFAQHSLQMSIAPCALCAAFIASTYRPQVSRSTIMATSLNLTTRSSSATNFSTAAIGQSMWTTHPRQLHRSQAVCLCAFSRSSDNHLVASGSTGCCVSDQEFLRDGRISRNDTSRGGAHRTASTIGSRPARGSTSTLPPFDAAVGGRRRHNLPQYVLDNNDMVKVKFRSSSQWLPAYRARQDRHRRNTMGMSISSYAPSFQFLDVAPGVGAPVRCRRAAAPGLVASRRLREPMVPRW